MITPYKNRTIDTTRPVEVYRNLHRSGCIYSIRQDRLVVGHTNTISLRDVRLYVNSNGFERYKRTGQREVFCWLIGFMCEPPEHSNFEFISFNPTQHNNFVYVHNNEPIEWNTRFDYIWIIEKDIMSWQYRK